METPEAENVFRHYLETEVTLCVPAHRMAVVVACKGGTVTGQPVYSSLSFDVVALRSSVRHWYKAEKGPGDAPPIVPTPEGMIQKGWQFDRTSKVIEPVIVEAALGQMATLDEMFPTHERIARSIVICWWPRELDREHLKSHETSLIERLKRGIDD